MENNSNSGRLRIIDRHYIAYFVIVFRFLVVFSAGLVLFYVVYLFKDKFSENMLLMLTLFILGVINWSFLLLVLRIVSQVNDIILLDKDKIIIMQSSLVLQDDIEIIHIYAINKFSKVRHGVISAIFNFADIIIEQQNDSIRVLKCVMNPNKAIDLIERHREYTINEGKKKYIINEGVTK